jgi:hypothetical protein
MSVIYAVISLLHRVRPLGQSLVALARGEITALGALMILAGGVAAFVDIAEDFSEDEARAFDMRVLTALHPGPNPADPIGPVWLDRAAQDFSALGSLAILATIALVVVGFLLMQKRALQAGLLAVALGGGLALSETMKFVFERTRPTPAVRAVTRCFQRCSISRSARCSRGSCRAAGRNSTRSASRSRSLCSSVSREFI